MKSTIVNLLGATAIAGSIAAAHPAEAAELVGTFNISSSSSQAVISSTSIDFFVPTSVGGPGPGSGPGAFAITDGQGSFTQFDPPPTQAGLIRDLNYSAYTSPGVNPPLTNFLQFSNALPGNSFTLTGLLQPFTFASGLGSASITVFLGGQFISSDGDITNGTGSLVFSYAGQSADSLQAILASGGSLQATGYTGQFAATAVPFPALAPGLLVLGSLGFANNVLSRRRNKQTTKV
ncbi:hypothetical protein [Anthocerotibacter panamensis]|uniref:hypothetical protein n=1 Tax=Anthocerotibacter panamensis TaxID=2857077 RepID=UPI001C403FA1|nr:hypothetical protein [Anthocerotibacter panamensis]